MRWALWILSSQEDFSDVKCLDASALGWYPEHHKRVNLGRTGTEGAKGAAADKEGHKDHRGFQFKIFSLCYVTSFDEACPIDTLPSICSLTNVQHSQRLRCRSA